MLPTDYKARKDFPLLTFLAGYFPDAIEALVELSKAGNAQHGIDGQVPTNSPFMLEGDRIAWDRDKSTNEVETMMRHLWDHERAKRGDHGMSKIDVDGVLHIVKAFWRAGAEAQKTIEDLRKAMRCGLDMREIAPGRFQTAEARADVASLGIKRVFCPGCGVERLYGRFEHAPHCTGVGI